MSDAENLNNNLRTELGQILNLNDDNKYEKYDKILSVYESLTNIEGLPYYSSEMAQAEIIMSIIAEHHPEHIKQLNYGFDALQDGDKTPSYVIENVRLLVNCKNSGTCNPDDLKKFRWFVLAAVAKAAEMAGGEC